MKTPLHILTFCVIAVASKFSEGDDKPATLPDLALQPPRVLTDFGPDHVKSSRGAQGVPAIERSAQGRRGMRARVRAGLRVLPVTAYSRPAVMMVSRGPRS